MKSAGKARSNGLYRHIRTSKEIIRNLLNYYNKQKSYCTEKNISAIIYYYRIAFQQFARKGDFLWRSVLQRRKYMNM